MKRTSPRIIITAVPALGLCIFLAFGTLFAPGATASRAMTSSPRPIAESSTPLTATPQTKGTQVSGSNTGRSDLPTKDAKSKQSPSKGSAPRGVSNPPVNDNCANAISINSCPFSDVRNTTDATDENGEPGSTCTSQGNSVWYTYTSAAPGGAAVSVGTCSSDFDTAIMVWRVTAGACDFATFAPVACNDDFCGDGLQSTVNFLAAPGQTYKIQVGGFDGETGNLTVNVSCTPINCPATVINGTLGSNDPNFPGPRSSGNQIGRLNRNGISSSCAAPKTCNLFTATGSRAFDAYTLTNNTGATACVFVQLNVTAATGNYQSNAYLGSYDPNNICTNYLADPGLSSGGAPQMLTSYSFNVPSGASVVLVVHTTNPGEIGGTYTLTVVGDLCQSCSLTCPANVTQSNDANQCGAVVSYPAPTTTGSCGTITCSPASASFFPVGTTTVTCMAAGGQSCSFTVTVSDTQPPSITCPANVTTVTDQNACVAAACQTVNFTTTASDNCPGVVVVCNPPSGGCFPTGTTTVTCTATDASNNTATCSFTVTTFDTALEDESNPATILLWNSITGQYRFCCSGITFTGVGKATRLGCVYTLDGNAADRRVFGRVDKAVHAGSGSLQSPAGTLRCTITDRNTLNDPLIPACQ
jgi:hypothetical protein